MNLLASILDDCVQSHPHKEALVCGDHSLDYATFNARACQVAHGLCVKGIQPNDHVALSCPNLIYFPILWMGIIKAGAVMVPLSTMLHAREMAHRLADSDAKLYICMDDVSTGSKGREAFSAVDSCEHFIVLPALTKSTSAVVDERLWNAFMDAQPKTFDTAHREPEDTCLIIYTSGTTGQPKGAALSHSNLMMNATMSKQLFELDQDTRSLIVLPLFHCFALSILNLTLLSKGTVVLMPQFEATAVQETLVDKAITLFAGVPTMYWKLLHNARCESLSPTLRVCLAGGAPFPLELQRDFEARYDVDILDGYGLSEASALVTSNGLHGQRKRGSVGQTLDGVEIQIVDPNMQEVPCGTVGEIIIRGHNVMKGYYNSPKSTQQVLEGGWLHTGDLGSIDDEGYVFIVDRLSDMIIRGGFNVYPREIEEVMMTHPAISLVAVVGVPDDVYGEEIKAFVTLKDAMTLDTQSLKSWCKEQIAAYKYPRIIEFSDALPLGPSGKILKKTLRLS